MSTNLNEKVLTTDSGLPISPITHAHSVVVNEDKRLDDFLQGIGTTDKELSETSTNPVENKVVYKEIKNIKDKILNENEEGTAGKVWGIASDGTPSWVSISGNSSSDSLVNGLSYEYTNITTSKIIAGAGDLFDKQDQDFTILAKIKKTNDGSNYAVNILSQPSDSNSVSFFWNWDGVVYGKWKDSGYGELRITPPNLSNDMTLYAYFKKSGNSYTLYADGETNSGNISGTLDESFAGTDITINGNNKNIDRILIYNRALTNTELKQALNVLENNSNINSDNSNNGGSTSGGTSSYSFMETIGDSLTFGGWGNTTSKILQTNYTNRAKNGAHLIGPTENDGYMVYQSTLVSEKCDLCCIMGGTNDSTDIVAGKIGELGTKDKTTYLGCYQTIIENLYEKNPKMAIFILTPPRRFDSTNAEYLKTLNDECKKLGEYYGIPVIDVYNNLGLNTITKSVLLNSDGLHFSGDGKIKLGTFVANQIVSY